MNTYAKLELSMDQEWKTQNEAPHSGSDQPSPVPQPVPEAVITPASGPETAAAPTVNSPVPTPATLAQPSQAVPPAALTPPDTLVGQNVYDQYNPGAGSSRKKIVVSILVLAILAISGGTYALLGQKQPQKVDNQAPAANNTASQSQPKSQLPVEEKKPAVPVSWKSVDPKMGFSLKIPADWALGLSSDFNLNDMKSKSITISDPKAEQGTFISAGIESLDNTKTQQEFEDYLTSGKAYTDLGVSKDEIKLTSKKLNINGKEWLEVDENESTSLTKGLYFWSNDHEIVLAAVSNKQSSLDELSEKYLLPMAASLEVK